MKPLHDEDFEAAAKRWLDELAQWSAGECDRVRAEYPDEYAKYAAAPLTAFWAWHGGPPDPDAYRPAWNAADATWYQVYETVSEGTPITPAFATEDELIEHLVQHGDGWGRPVSRPAAENFVRKSQWVPSMLITNGVITSGIEIAAGFVSPSSGKPPSADAVDPQVGSTGKLTTRDKGI